MVAPRDRTRSRAEDDINSRKAWCGCLGLESGKVLSMIEPKDDGRATAHIEHVKLGAGDDVAHGKELWADGLAALDETHP